MTISNLAQKEVCNLTISQHAIERYQKRVDSQATDEEAKRELMLVYERGNKWVFRKRDPRLSSNITKIYFEYEGIRILVYSTKKSQAIISCFGDRVLNKWYKHQRRKRNKRFVLS